MEKVSVPISSRRKNDIEESEKNYIKIAQNLGAIIREISDLSVPEETIQNWKTLSSSIFIVDDKLDSTSDKEQRAQITTKIINFLKEIVVDFSDDENLERAMKGLKNLSNHLQDRQKEFFLNSLIRTLKITESIKIEGDPKNLVKLTRIEGQVAVKIFLPFLPEEFRVSEKYGQLVYALTRLGRVSNSFDTFLDLPSDYRDNQVKVQPSIVNRLLFLGAVLSDGLPLIKTTGIISIDFLKRSLRVSRAVIKDR